MEVAILCGGMGTRLKEITDTIPKPLIPIGPLPMVRHIMNHYMHFGHENFILALGYKQEAFKHYFKNVVDIESDVTYEYWARIIPQYYDNGPNFRVTLTDTGPKTNTATRLYRLKKYIKGETFLLTYGDGLSTVDINAVIRFHKRRDAIATITGIHPQSKFGEISQEEGFITSFEEKPKVKDHLTNGGFMVMEREIFDYLPENNEWELEDTFQHFITRKHLCVYHHKGFWKNADTLKDIGELREMWDSGNAPWIVK